MITFDSAEGRVIRRCALGEAWVEEAGLDWGALLEAARRHGVSPLVARAAMDHVDEGTRDVLKAELRRSVAAGMIQEDAMQRVVSSLASAGIESLVVKGQVLSLEAYGEIGMRGSTDIDVVVRPDDADAARRVLVADGFAISEDLSDAEWRRVRRALSEWLFVRGYVAVDLHWCLTGSVDAFTLGTEEVFAGAREVGEVERSADGGRRDGFEGRTAVGGRRTGAVGHDPLPTASLSAGGERGEELPPTAARRPPTTDHRPPPADHRPPTTDHDTPTADRRPPTAPPVRTLSREHLALYLAVHGAKHEWERFEWLASFAAIWRRDGLDRDAVRALASRCGASRRLALAERLLERVRSGSEAREEWIERACDRIVAGWFGQGGGHEEPAAHVLRTAAMYDRPLLDTARALLTGIFSPRVTDWRAIPLPDALGWAYPLLRPVRLVWRKLGLGNEMTNEK